MRHVYEHGVSKTDRVAEMRSDAEIAKPAAYWTRAVCNMALDYLRRQERENSYRTHGVDVETLEIPDSRSPERLLFESQAIRLIDQALDEVPPKTRETFELYRSEEHTSELQSPCNLV